MLYIVDYLETTWDIASQVNQKQINKNYHVLSFFCPILSNPGVQIHGPVSFSVSFPKQTGRVLNQSAPGGTVSVPAVPSGR